MLINRDKLEKELNIILQHYNAKKKIKEKIIKRFQEFGFYYGDVNSIISGTNPIMQLSEEILWLLVIVLYEFVEDEYKTKINPENILTEGEITKAKNIIIEKESNKDIYPIVIENVNKDDENDYSTTFTSEKISEFYDNRIFKYNYETQRPRISKWYGGKEVLEIHLNEKNKKAITNNILNGTQIPNVITVNILDDENSSIEYDSNKRTLTIFSGNVDLIDGWHRGISTRNAYKINSNIKFYLKVRIVHWEIDKAKAFIHQESLGTQLDPLAKKSYDVYNFATQAINKLNENPRCSIRGKITTDQREIISNKAIVMFNTLFDSVNILFNIDTNIELIQISNYLKDGINLLIENDITILSGYKTDQEWVAYMIILKKFYQLYEQKEDWSEKIIESVNKINVNELLQIQYKIINKPFIKRVEDYINERMVLANV